MHRHRVAFIAALLLSPLALHAAEPKPNVLLIMADDLRDFGGAFTKEVVKTPNLDRLRARGTSREDTPSAPSCNPRAALLAGRRRGRDRH